MPKCKPKYFFATKRPDICLSFAVHPAYKIVPENMVNTLALHLRILDISQVLVEKPEEKSS